MRPVLLTFDLFGTVLDWTRGLREALLRAGRDVSPAVVDRIVDHQGAAEQRAPFRRYRDIAAASLVEVGGLPAAEADAVGASLGGWPPFPDAAEGLRRLLRVAPCVAMTNSDRAHRAEVEAGLGLRLPAWFCAEDLRLYKPAVGFWRAVSSRLGIPSARPGGTSPPTATTTSPPRAPWASPASWWSGRTAAPVRTTSPCRTCAPSPSGCAPSPPPGSDGARSPGGRFRAARAAGRNSPRLRQVEAWRNDRSATFRPVRCSVAVVRRIEEVSIVKTAIRHATVTLAALSLALAARADDATHADREKTAAQVRQTLKSEGQMSEQAVAAMNHDIEKHSGQHGYGEAVSATVHQAQAAGCLGTCLAEAVHQVNRAMDQGKPAEESSRMVGKAVAATKGTEVQRRDQVRHEMDAAMRDQHRDRMHDRSQEMAGGAGHGAGMHGGHH